MEGGHKRRRGEVSSGARLMNKICSSDFLLTPSVPTVVVGEHERHARPGETQPLVHLSSVIEETGEGTVSGCWDTYYWRWRKRKRSRCRRRRRRRRRRRKRGVESPTCGGATSRSSEASSTALFCADQEYRMSMASTPKVLCTIASERTRDRARSALQAIRSFRSMSVSRKLSTCGRGRSSECVSRCKRLC